MEPDNKLEMIDFSKSDISITIKDIEKPLQKENETTLTNNKHQNIIQNPKPQTYLSKKDYRTLYLSQLRKTKLKRNYLYFQLFLKLLIGYYLLILLIKNLLS